MEDFRTIWENDTNDVVVIDQRLLPHHFETKTLVNYKEAVNAIKEMVVRGAPLIGATAAYGVYLACREAADMINKKEFIDEAFHHLADSRPTAVNLFWALNRMKEVVYSTEFNVDVALNEARNIVNDDIETCRLIGVHGLPLIEEISKRKNGGVVNILTHCNAGMLGCIKWGTISSPIYQAKLKGIEVHVWVDETRPRNQGANLTTYELTKHNIPHTLIVDNTGGHLMQHGMVDLVIVGSDRTTKRGDVANKIGTYLKALAAFDNKIPFFVALPSTTIDWNISDGLKEIPIEERNQDEVRYSVGKSKKTGDLDEVLVCPETTPAANYGFDVTPAKLITGLITERGICPATENGLKELFPEF